MSTNKRKRLSTNFKAGQSIQQYQRDVEKNAKKNLTESMQDLDISDDMDVEVDNAMSDLAMKMVYALIPTPEVVANILTSGW